MLLGERVAISILRDYAATFNEDFKAFTFTPSMQIKSV